LLCVDWLFLSVVLIGFGLSGCAMVGNYGFTNVDLDGNLTAQTLNRYEQEWKAIQANGEGDSCMTQTRADQLVAHRPPHLLEPRFGDAFGRPRRSLVHGIQGLGTGADVYRLCRRRHGHVRTPRANGSAHGRLELLLGMVGMVHNSDAILEDGRRQKTSSGHLVHHLLAYHTMDGHTQVSLLTGPNPVGFDMHAGHTMPAGPAAYPATLPPFGGAPSAAVPAPAAPVPALSPSSSSRGPGALPYPFRRFPRRPARLSLTRRRRLHLPESSPRRQLSISVRCIRMWFRPALGNCPICKMALGCEEGSPAARSSQAVKQRRKRTVRRNDAS